MNYHEIYMKVLFNIRTKITKTKKTISILFFINNMLEFIYF